MRFEPGRPVVRRYLRGGYVTWAQAARVVADGASGLLLWIPQGSGFACRCGADGRRLREAPLSVYAGSGLVLDEWRQTSCLVLIRPRARHSLWWVFRQGRFDGWYVNLEEPASRWSNHVVAGVDTSDHGLDVVVSANRSWRWKDEPEFAEYTGEPGYWTAADAQLIRAEGRSVVAELEAGGFPFDGTWCDFRPDELWAPDPLPAPGWQS